MTAVFLPSSPSLRPWILLALAREPVSQRTEWIEVSNRNRLTLWVLRLEAAFVNGDKRGAKGTQLLNARSKRAC